jgi:hypothetical protein
MLKLVSPRPHAQRRAAPTRVKKGDGVRMLHRWITGDRLAGDSAQRTVARARRTVIDVHCGVRRAESRAARLLTNPEHARLLADIAGRLEDIHQRLLLFSTSIELEMDRLDMVQAEVEHLGAPPRAGDHTR